MKMNAILAAMILLAAASFADSLNQADKWFAYSDKADGGSSTISLAPANETIDGKESMVLTIKGEVTTKFKYGYVGLATTPDDETMKALKSASGIKFKVRGDGNNYRLRLETSDVKDYNFNGVTFATTKGKVTEVVLPYAKASQENWGTPKKFKAENLGKISIHTVGQPIASYELKIFDFQVIK